MPCNAEALVLQRSFSGRGYRGSPSRTITAAERAAEIRELGRKGDAQEAQYLQSLSGSPVHWTQAMREMETRDALRRSASFYGTDPFAKRQERAKEIARLRRG